MVEVDNAGSLLVMTHGRHPTRNCGKSLEESNVLLALTALQTSGQPFLQGGIHLSLSGALGQILGLVAGVEPFHQLGCAPQLDFGTGGGAAAGALVEVQGEAVDEAPGAGLAGVGPLAGAVQPTVEFEVDVLGELHPTQLTLVRLLSRVQTQVGFQVAGAAEAFVAHLWTFRREHPINQEDDNLMQLPHWHVDSEPDVYLLSAVKLND